MTSGFEVNNIFNNKYFSTLVITLLVLYASLLGPTLPPFIKSLFENSLFKIFVLFLLIIRGNGNPVFSLIIVICFVVSLETLNTQTSINKFTNNSNNALN